MNLITEHKLAEGLKVVLNDATRHYYGGYYHVRLQAIADVPLNAGMFDSQAAFDDALKAVGPLVRFEKALEKMAVPESETESVRQSLLASFQDNLLPYLSRPDFPRRFILSEYEKAVKAKAAYNGKRS